MEILQTFYGKYYKIKAHNLRETADILIVWKLNILIQELMLHSGLVLLSCLGGGGGTRYVLKFAGSIPDEVNFSICLILPSH
jgi:hypothetical protein